MRRRLSSLVPLGMVSILVVAGVLAVAAPTAPEGDSRATGGWTATPSDWTTFRGDNGRTGVSHATATMKIAVYKWAYRTGGSRISSSPVVANVDLSDPNPELLVGSEDYRLYCLNATSGRLKWRYTTQGMVSGSPAVGDINGDGLAEVVFGSADGRVYALSGSNGTLLWRYTTRAAVLASPAIDDINGDGKPEVVAASMDGMVYALRGDGTRLWRATVIQLNDKSGEGIYASPSIADVFNDGWMKVLVSAGEGLSVFNGTDGARENGFEWGTATGQSHYLATPAVKDINGDGKMEIFSFYSDPPRLYATSLFENGASASGYMGIDWVRVVSSPAICDGDGDDFQEVYFGTDSGRVVAVQVFISDDPHMAPQLMEEWSRNVTGPVRSSPTLADLDGDKKMELVVGSDNRRVVCLNAEDGTISWVHMVPKAVFSSPAVADGDLDGKAEVFFGCYDGVVYALDYNF